MLKLLPRITHMKEHVQHNFFTTIKFSKYYSLDFNSITNVMTKALMIPICLTIVMKKLGPKHSDSTTCIEQNFTLNKSKFILDIQHFKIVTFQNIRPPLKTL